MHWVPALPASRGKSPAVKAVMGERCPRWLSPMGTVVICIMGLSGWPPASRTARRTSCHNAFHSQWKVRPRLRGSAGTHCIGPPAVPTGSRSYAKLADMSIRNPVATLEAVTQQIIDLIRQDVVAPDLTADSSLQSQGLDSLTVMSLVFKIEDHYDIVLDAEEADDLRTVGDLAALVVRRFEQQS